MKQKMKQVNIHTERPTEKTTKYLLIFSFPLLIITASAVMYLLNFIVNGVAGIAGVILGGLGIMTATMVSLAVWCLTFPVATAMLAILFKRARE